MRKIIGAGRVEASAAGRSASHAMFDAGHLSEGRHFAELVVVTAYPKLA